MSAAISIDGLVKRFPRPMGYRDLLPFRRRSSSATALAGISLDVEEGELFGLLGPNGAGKTTLMKILSTLVLPSAGSAHVHGCDVVDRESEVKRMVGLITSDERSFYWRLTGRQNLEFFASLHHLTKGQAKRRIEDLLELVGLAEAADQRFQTYSTGMRQKMAIARGLLADPRVLLVDEPTRSLDPVSAQAVRIFLKEKVVSEGRTVLLATHQMTEAEQLCDRVAIISRGHILACGTLKELRLAHRRDRCYLEVENFEENQWSGIAGVAGVTGLWTNCREDGVVAFEVGMENSRSVLPGVLSVIVCSGGVVRACNVRERPLEEIFMDVVDVTDRGRAPAGEGVLAKC